MERSRELWLPWRQRRGGADRGPGDSLSRGIRRVHTRGGGSSNCGGGSPQLVKSLAVTLGMVVFFFAGWPIAKVAIIAGALLLITRRVPKKSTPRWIGRCWCCLRGCSSWWRGSRRVRCSRIWCGCGARAFGKRRGAQRGGGRAFEPGSNVPAVLVFQPFIPHLPDPMLGWLRLAMASTLAGNLTILGSIAI